MTDRDPADLSEEEVARLLADLGGPEPVPADVQARLDDTLAALVRGEEPGGEQSGGGAEVVPLRRERLSRRGRGLLAAAAVLGVVGLGVGVAGGLVDGLTGSGSESGSAAQDSAAGGDTEVADGGARGSADEAAPEQERTAEDSSAEPDAMRDTPGPPPDAVARIDDEQSLRSAVRALVLGRAALSELASAQDADKQPRDRAARAGCAVPGTRSATTAPVTYRGEPATLVVRPVGADEVEGNVYSCSRGLLVDSVRIASPQE